MKKKYQKPKFNKITIDKQISLVMMTDEETSPSGPFGQSVKEIPNKSNNTYRA